MSAIRVAIRVSGLDRPAWQADVIARLRGVPGVAIVETSEPPLTLPVDLLVDTTELPTPALGGSLPPCLGIWRFVYGPEARLTDPCTHEHAAGERGVMARLVSLAPDGSATLLETCVLKAVTHSLSATRAHLFGCIADWPARALRRVLADGMQVKGPPVAMSGAGRSGAPAQSGGAVLGLKTLMRRLSREFIEEHWALGIIHKPVHHAIDAFDARDIQWLQAPEGLALADPAGAVERDGRLTILAEAYDFNDRQGRVVTLDVENGRIVSPPREVLRQSVHLSYPHLVFHQGQIYCLPELCGLGRVQLFRADPFPERWVPDRILLQSFAGVDTTLCHHAGRWWMFTGNHNDQDEAKLFLFHASDPFGPWEPHALNPVKCDLRSARPAGPLFEHNGALYRPAQDGSATYGGAIALNRIRALSPTEFEEATVNILRPAPGSPYPDGLHTLTGVGDVTLVDGKRHARSFKRLAWGLKQLARERLSEAAPDHGSPQTP